MPLFSIIKCVKSSENIGRGHHHHSASKTYPSPWPFAASPWVCAMDYARFVDFLSFTATASTIGMFLCGLQICSRIRMRGSTDGTGVAPFFLTSVSCICWLGYGILRRDQAVIFVNSVGLVFQTIYLTYYYVNTRLKARLNRLIFLEMVVSVITVILINGDLLNETEKENLLGIVCMFLNIATIASPLVDVGQVLRTKNTESLPFMLCLANLAVCVQWLLYGLLVDDFYMKVRWLNFLPPPRAMFPIQRFSFPLRFRMQSERSSPRCSCRCSLSIRGHTNSSRLATCKHRRRTMLPIWEGHLALLFLH